MMGTELLFRGQNGQSVALNTHRLGVKEKEGNIPLPPLLGVYLISFSLVLSVFLAFQESRLPCCQI